LESREVKVGQRFRSCCGVLGERVKRFFELGGEKEVPGYLKSFYYTVRVSELCKRGKRENLI